MKPYNEICSTECFHINFWNERVKDKDDLRSVIVNHSAYCIGDENSKSYFRGFGGNKFKIQFFDGRYVESTNLWSNGDIPVDYWDSLPDNAEFIKDKPSTYSELFL